MNDWPEDASVDPPSNGGFAPGDKCPVCGTTDLVFEDGEAQTFEEPGYADTMWCPECHLGHPVDYSRIPDEESEYYEALNRGYNQDRI